MLFMPWQLFVTCIISNITNLNLGISKMAYVFLRKLFCIPNIVLVSNKGMLFENFSEVDF